MNTPIKRIPLKALFYGFSFATTVSLAHPLQAIAAVDSAASIAAAIENQYALIQTSEGAIKVKLLTAKAPKTVENFVGLAKGTKEWKHPSGNPVKGRSVYFKLPFHKIVTNQLIQSGDPTGTGKGGPGFVIDDEISPKDNFNHAGVLAMAHDEPNKNGSQFFITAKATPSFKGHYTVFGEVTEGLDVVKKIAALKKDKKTGKPINVPIIYYIQVLDNQPDKALNHG